MIFLHGLGGTGQIWRPIAASLEDSYQLLCPDQRGHGQSIPPREDWRFSPENYSQDIEDTAVHHGFHPSWVIGHSMGVRTAVGYANLSPERVEGVVLVDLGFSGLAGGGVGDALAEFLKILPERFPTRAEARTFMDQNCPDPSIGQYLIAVSQPAPEGGILFPFSHEALLQTVEEARGSETFAGLEAYAKKSGKPVYVLRGARSRVYLKEDFTRDQHRARALTNVHFIELEGAGHGLPFEKRTEFIEMLKTWIPA